LNTLRAPKKRVRVRADMRDVDEREKEEELTHMPQSKRTTLSKKIGKSTQDPNWKKKVKQRPFNDTHISANKEKRKGGRTKVKAIMTETVLTEQEIKKTDMVRSTIGEADEAPRKGRRDLKVVESAKHMETKKKRANNRE